MTQPRQQRVIGVPLGVHVTSSSNPEENTSYRTGGDILVLLDEVFNSSTRAVCVYGRVGNIMLEDGTFVEGPDDMVEDALDDTFTDEDMLAVAQVLPYNASLLAVNVNGVAVTDTSIVALCDALRHTRVRLVDLTNTVLDDESGVALLQLAQSNLHLRTVVVDDTLIAEQIMDEIDMACLNNEALVPDLPPPPPIDPARPRYCVMHFFQMCPDGAYCAWTHGAPPMPRRADEDRALATQTQTRRTLESVAARAVRAQRDAEEVAAAEAAAEAAKAKVAGAAAAAAASSSGDAASSSTAAADIGKKLSQRRKECVGGSGGTKAKKSGTTSSSEAAADQQQQQQKNEHEDSTGFDSGLLVKGVVVMAVSGVVAWFVMKKLT